MSKVIEIAKVASDAVNEGSSYITDNLDKIFSQVNLQKDGVIIEIPWNITVNGEHQDAITVILMKVTGQRVYFINPVKVSNKPCEITEKDNKGPARIIEEDGFESMLIDDLVELSTRFPIRGIIRDWHCEKIIALISKY